MVCISVANGECFRKKGKTDLSIEYENRAAFVAECKIWAGKKVFSSALAQLQSYTTWRDNKLCLVIFSRNKDFFKVLNEIKETIPPFKYTFFSIWVNSYYYSILWVLL